MCINNLQLHTMMQFDPDNSLVLPSRIKMFKCVLITLFISLASAREISLIRQSKAPLLKNVGSPLGVVSPIDRCGGGGLPVELRIEGCSGAPPCTFISDTDYDIEGDFIPHQSSDGVNLKLTIIVGGIQVPVLDVPLEGAINAGDLYTIYYSITPSSLLAGQRINLELQVYHTMTNVLEICLSAPGIIE